MLVTLLSSVSGFAQIGIEAHGHRGFLLPHRQNMLHLPHGPAMAGELRVFKQCDGSKDWHNLYNRPQVGVTIRGIDLANHELLGYGLAVGAFISSPVVSTKRFSWSLEMASGLGYVSKPFDFETNYQNIAIGSYLNAYIMLGQRFSYKLNNVLALHSAMSFNHMSNAAFTIPNLGLNYPMISFGMSWLPETKDTLLTYQKPKGRKKGYWDLSMSFGVKETFNPRDVKFPAYNISFQRAIGLSRKSSIAPGLDIFYNSALIATRESLGDTIGAGENLQLGLRTAYQLHIDRLTVSLAIGAYLRDTYKKEGIIYNRAGLRYYISEHWGINLSLKTHFFKADFFELGAAYKF